MNTEYIVAIALCVVTVVGAAASLAKRSSHPKLNSAIAVCCLMLATASLTFTSIGAATGAIFIPEPDPYFDPSLNGYYENRPNAEGGSYTGNFKGGYYYKVQGTQTYIEAGSLYASYTGAFAYDKRHGPGTMTYVSGQVLSGLWSEDSFLGKDTGEEQ